MKAQHTSSAGDTWPLSSSQNRIWFMEKMESEISAYNNPLDYHITGQLNKEVLTQTLNFLVNRHESFRTVFPEINGLPVQKVLPSIWVSVKITDISKETADRQKEIILHRSEENATRKYDLEKGPLFNFELLILGEKDSHLLLGFHHIISDALSLDIFLEEFRNVYTTLAESRHITLEKTGSTYKDYAVRELDWFESQEYRKKLEYWKQEIAGVPEILALPADFNRPKTQRFRGAEIQLIIEKELKDKLTAAGKKYGASLPVVLFSAFGVLVSRYAAQDDLVIGVPFANRSREELQRLVGVLINSLPIRVSVNESTTFSQVLSQTRSKFLTAFENLEVPFEKLVEELKVKRANNINPVFQVLFNFLTENHKEVDLEGAFMTVENSIRNFSQVDLDLTVHDQQTRILCDFQYNTDLYKGETIEMVTRHFLSILQSVSTLEDHKVSKIPLLTPEEYRMIISEWNATDAQYPESHSINSLFEEQAAKTPDLVAVSDGPRQLSYRELNEQANQLAHHLVKQGAGKGTVIGVFLDRTVDLPMSLLAVAKSGGTYLPLDPIYPGARLGQIIGDAKPLLILTSSLLLSKLPDSGYRTLLVDDKQAFSSESHVNLPAADPASTAYILYTSGSTGKPKGVPIRHNSLVNIVDYFSKILRVSQDDILLAVTTISFDIAGLEIFLPIVNGAKLVIASPETSMDPGLLADRIRDEKITLFQATPVTFRALVSSGWPGKTDLKILIGGEAFMKDLGRDLVPLCSELWNCYGPTETTIWSAVKKVASEDTLGEGVISIGRPVANTQLYVLNQSLIPVPTGVPGELYIGGAGVSDGYLNLPELSAEKFIKNPLVSGVTGKLYRTGDLVRYSTDGDLHFLNRVDSQVKIRGFRIELGEIETTLSSHPSVKENVVMVRELRPGEKILACYYIKKAGETVKIADLRRFLGEKLPEYMIPASFMEMEQFPLTGNNKVDKKLLPMPEIQGNASRDKIVPPGTPTEKKLAKIWESTLKIEKIGIHDDFFEAGGHSMVAASMINKIEKEFGTRLPLSALFEKSTIEGLAELIDSTGSSGTKRPQIKSKESSFSILSSISTLFNKKS